MNRIKNALGYILIYMPDHPNAQSSGYISEHRWIMSNYLKRSLTDEEVVHHINGIRDDNCLENFMLFSYNGEHLAYEASRRNAKARSSTQVKHKLILEKINTDLKRVSNGQPLCTNVGR